MEGESDVTESITDEVHSSDIRGNQIEVKVVLLEVSLLNFILRLSNEIKWKVKMVLLEVSLTNLILRIS